MTKRRSFIGGALAVGAGLHLSGPARAAGKPLKIGVINPFSGLFALYGDELARSYQLAADETNAKGGLLGRPIELVRGDSGTPQQGIGSVQLLADQGVEAFIGCYLSTVALAASDAALQVDKLYWETNAQAPKVTDRRLPNVIRGAPDVLRFSELSVRGIKDLICPALGKPLADVKILIEHEDSEYGTAQNQNHVRILKELGAKNVTSNAHSFKAVDFTDSILKAKSIAPDLYVTITYVPVNNMLLRTAKDQGFAPPAILLVGTGDTPETLQAIGAKDLEGVLVTGYPQPTISDAYGPGAGAFLATYRKTYNRDPVAPQAMTAYVGAQMMFEAIAAAGSTDMGKVQAAAAKMDKPLGSYPTGYGLKFDDSFQNTRAYPTLVQWQGGKVVTVFPKEAMLAGTTLVSLKRT